MMAARVYILGEMLNLFITNSDFLNKKKRYVNEINKLINRTTIFQKQSLDHLRSDTCDTRLSHLNNQNKTKIYWIQMIGRGSLAVNCMDNSKENF